MFPATSVQGIEPSTITSTYPKIITLDIGGRKFRTSLATLRAESGLFRRQLSDTFTWTPEADGTYFLDADPDLFEHLLRFMRRPEAFPLFYDASRGFDYDLYNKLEIEAEYFQIHELHEWIQGKKYLQAVKIKSSPAVVEEAEDMKTAYMSPNQFVERHAVSHARKVYICPRRLQCHRGNRGSCGAACMKAQGDDDDEYEDESYTEVVSVKTTVEFDGPVCRLA